MRIVFAGTPEVAVPALRALAESAHEVVLVVTRPDAPLGRKRVLTPSPVAQAAEGLGLPVLKTARLDEDATDAILGARPDLGVIVAYGGLVREPLLSAPSHGWVNLHFSRLPLWRGAAPVQRALMAGDDELGWAVFSLVAELDAGDVLVEETYRPDAEATAGEVLLALADEAAPRLAEVADALERGTTGVPQVGAPTFAAKLSLADGRLDPQESARVMHDRYRGVTPEPGAFVTIAGAPLKIAAMRLRDDERSVPSGEIRTVGRSVMLGTAAGAVELVTVQPAGKGRMNAGDWWRGLRVDSLTVDGQETGA